VEVGKQRRSASCELRSPTVLVPSFDYFVHSCVYFHLFLITSHSSSIPAIPFHLPVFQLQSRKLYKFPRRKVAYLKGTQVETIYRSALCHQATARQHPAPPYLNLIVRQKNGPPFQSTREAEFTEGCGVDLAWAKGLSWRSLSDCSVFPCYEYFFGGFWDFMCGLWNSNWKDGWFEKSTDQQSECPRVRYFQNLCAQLLCYYPSQRDLPASHKTLKPAYRPLIC